MGEDKKSVFVIQNGTGAQCGYCGKIIGSHEKELTIANFPFRHYHLEEREGCEGWIKREWKFITSLLWVLADIGGDDYRDTLTMLIEMWEQGS